MDYVKEAIKYDESNVFSVASFDVLIVAVNEKYVEEVISCLNMYPQDHMALAAFFMA